MKTTELRDVIQGLLPDWFITINEQKMLNVQADELETHKGFGYVEEFAQTQVVIDKWTKREITTHDVYLCVLGEYGNTSEQREKIREERIMPAIRAIENHMVKMERVKEFKRDLYPRGFDAEEILVHLEFKTEVVDGTYC